MIVVFYAPIEGDLLSGPITGCREATLEMVLVAGRPFRQVGEYRQDWNATHEVVAGEVVPRDAAALAVEAAVAGRRRLRVRRNSLLRDAFDPIFLNPIRWSALSSVDQIALLDWRDLLLTWPDDETDLVNPTMPPAPAFLGEV